ncbi:hypothetical protein SCAR479_06967 [Seiridium cardinale]|uniref:Uncharacterized protein n=1 Tax=Seiridium cardinale TaxID=138064 RepID=A0ABR2XRB3_9PEZI
MSRSRSTMPHPRDMLTDDLAYRVMKMGYHRRNARSILLKNPEEVDLEVPETYFGLVDADEWRLMALWINYNKKIYKHCVDMRESGFLTFPVTKDWVPLEVAVGLRWEDFEGFPMQLEILDSHDDQAGSMAFTEIENQIESLVVAETEWIPGVAMGPSFTIDMYTPRRTINIVCCIRPLPQEQPGSMEVAVAA